MKFEKLNFWFLYMYKDTFSIGSFFIHPDQIYDLI